MTPPAVSTLILSVATAALAVAFVVLLATQPRATAETPRCNEITGLVLDGGPTTTGPVSSARRPVAQIPWRELGAPTTTTTEKECE